MFQVSLVAVWNQRCLSLQGIELSQTKMPPISEGSNFKGWGVQLVRNRWDPERGVDLVP